VRIPIYSKSPKSKRVEFRCPDPSSNPYLCFAAQLMAGLDGIRNRIDPGQPIDKDLYELEPEEAAKVKSTPGSLGEVLDALETDHDWLFEGNVFDSERLCYGPSGDVRSDQISLVDPDNLVLRQPFAKSMN
jgi:glutamine synthetase